MSEANKAIVSKFFEEVFNEGKLELTEELIAPNHINHDPNAPEVDTGPEGIRQLVGMYRNAFPDIRFEIEEMVSEGQRVAHRWTFRGTHRGEMMSIEPAGRRVAVAGMEINRVRNEKIEESWSTPTPWA